MGDVEISNDRARLVLSRQGASILRWDALRPGRPPLPLIRPSKGPLAFGCQLLVPWSNRISGGGFEFDGRFHPVEPNIPSEPLPLHGDGFQKHWRLSRWTAKEAELVLDHGAIGPYRYRAHVRYTLENSALIAILAVENRATIRLPYGLGFHPWFQRHAGTLLKASAQQVWLEDEHHLPTGVIPVASRPEWCFSDASPLPGTWINNAFGGWNGRASILQPEDGVAIALEASSPLDVFILYSPSAESGFFCFEPVSHPVDAHHGMGLRTLDPGEAMSVSMRMEWATVDRIG